MKGNIDTSSISSQILFCTVRVVGQKGDGDTSVGTAFFFTFKDSACEFPVLVTNKHVVEGCAKGTFLLHEANQDGKPAGSLTVAFENFDSQWIGHPADVDLCAMPIAPLLRAAQQQGKSVFRRSFTEDQIPTSGMLGSLMALEDVIMVGYPIGLWDSKNNLPILRRGITASHPVVDFEDRPEGLIDIAAFPGSSGSPVSILNQGSFATPKGISMRSRFLFLGILYGGPQYRADGTMEIVEIPTAQVPSVRTHIPIHIGTYIKSRELLEIKRVLLELAKKQE